MRAEAKASVRSLISQFESGQQSFWQFAGTILRLADSFAVRFRTLAENQLHWLEAGEIPPNGSGH
jgi:hypothetical protein